jgi:hypothetical protein
VDKVLRATTRRELADEGNADLRWWLSRSAAERIAAVETLRQQYIAERFDVEPRLQRVCRVTRLHERDLATFQGADDAKTS